VSAAEIEALVIRTLREHLDPLPLIEDQGLIDDFVARVEIHRERLVIQLADASGKKSHEGNGNIILHAPWQKANSTRRRELILPEGAGLQKLRPIRSENRARLIASIARGRRWLDELLGDPTATSESIAKRESCSVRKVNMAISLAFLAPDLVRARWRAARFRRNAACDTGVPRPRPSWLGRFVETLRRLSLNSCCKEPRAIPCVESKLSPGQFPVLVGAFVVAATAAARASAAGASA